MKTFETRNDIKARILKEAAREWGYRGSSSIDLEAFDPIVDLMVGACSFELERLSHDITNSRNRIFERLVEILTPDTMTQAQPAHGIVHAAPVEHRYITQETDQVFYKHPEYKRELYFSPIDAFSIIQAKVKYMAYDNKVLQLNERLERDLVAEASYGKYIQRDTIYLGLEVGDEVRSLQDLMFFFDWKNEIKINALLKYLPLTKWQIGGQSIAIKSGFNTKHRPQDLEKDIFNTMGVDTHLKNQVLDLVKGHYITLVDDVDPRAVSSRYPDALLQTFVESELTMLTQDMVWIEITLPHLMADHVREMDCLTNAIPMVNRQLHQKQEKLDKDLPILAIEVNDAHFLAVESVKNTSGTAYMEVPLKVVDTADHGMYAIRSRGVNRFDSREAKHLLTYVMDMVRDEAVAFKGLGYSNLSSDLGEMDILFNRMKKNFNRSAEEVDNTHFLFAKPYPNDDMAYIQYWTTDGDLANKIPHGTPLKLMSTIELDPRSLQLVTTTRGGRNQLAAVDSIHAFKEAVMTRGRIVTPEDIKTFCISALGFRNIRHIQVKRGVAVSPNAHEGLIRTLDVHIDREPNSTLSAQDWQILCNETEIKLDQRSAGIYPIRILSAS